MKTVLKLSLLAVVLLMTTAAPAGSIKAEDAAAPISVNATTLDSAQVTFEALFFRDCITGTTKVTALKGGGTEYSCTKKGGGGSKSNGGNGQHTLGTMVWLRTDKGTFQLSIGDSTWDTTHRIYGITLAAYVNSAWGTYRTVFYPERKTVEKVEELPKTCSREREFCFDVFEDTCHFIVAGHNWWQYCRNLQSIRFNVNP